MSPERQNPSVFQVDVIFGWITIDIWKRRQVVYMEHTVVQAWRDLCSRLPPAYVTSPITGQISSQDITPPGEMPLPPLTCHSPSLRCTAMVTAEHLGFWGQISSWHFVWFAELQERRRLLFDSWHFFWLSSWKLLLKLQRFALKDNHRLTKEKDWKIAITKSAFYS